jgi:hypothetical protein
MLFHQYYRALKGEIIMKNLILSVALLIGFNQASANILTFDDLPTPAADGSLIRSYQGFDVYTLVNNELTGVGYIDPTPFLTPGVDYTGFDKNVMFNPNGFLGNNATFINSIVGDGKFDFNSGFWSAGVTGDVTIRFSGIAGNVFGPQLFNSEEYLLKRDVITPITLNWFGLDQLIIISTPGIWVADNLEFDREEVSSVPVPAAVWLFGTAMLGFAGLRRKSV